MGGRHSGLWWDVPLFGVITFDYEKPQGMLGFIPRFIWSSLFILRFLRCQIPTDFDDSYMVIFIHLQATQTGRDLGQ